MRKLLLALGFALIALATISVLAVFLILAGDAAPHPTDQSLFLLFYDHKAVFDDAVPALVGDDIGGPITALPAGLLEKRKERVHALFQSVGYEGNIERKWDVSGVAFIVASRRFGDVDPKTFEFEVTEKGYAYSPFPPSHQATLLDGRHGDRAELVYKHIAGEWYLYFERGFGKPE